MIDHEGVSLSTYEFFMRQGVDVPRVWRLYCEQKLPDSSFLEFLAAKHPTVHTAWRILK